MSFGRFQLRRDTAANWTSNNPTLAAGECGFETDTNKLKIGDGSTAWTSLSYFAGGASYTDEMAQDAVGTILVDSSTIDFTYSDATPSITASVIDDSITYAKIQNVSATDKVLGRSTAGAGDIEEITMTAAGRALMDDVDAAAQRTTLGLGTLATQSGTFSGTSSGTNTGDQTISLTGDVTGSGTGSFAATIANDAVTYAKLQNVSATDKILGRVTAGAGDVEEIDCTAAGRALLDDADASAQRTTLGLGTLATQSGTFSGTSSGTNTGDQNLFNTIQVSGQSDVVADGATDVLTFVAGSGMTITTNAATDTITFASSGSAANTFGTIAVSGQSDVVADSTTDTLTLVAGSNVTITTDASTDTITIAASGSGGVTDGDKGDITVSASGATWTIDNDAVTFAKMQNVSTDVFLGRDTAGTGDVEELSVATAKTLLGLTGTNSGDQTITLTGDVTGSGTGSFAATIANDSVTYAKMQNISATDRLLGRDSALAGDTEELTVSGGIVFTGSGGIQTSAFTGDVTKSAGGTSLTIANDAVTFAKMQNVSTDIFLGRDTAGTGDVEELSVATAKTLLGLTGTNSGDQNLFSTVAVSGQSDVVADSTTDTLTFAAGTGMTITTTAGSDTVTFATSITQYTDELAQDAIGGILVDSSTIDFTYSDATPSITADVLDGSITFAKMQNVSTDIFLGRDTAGTGNVEELSVATAKTLLNLTGTNSGDQTITLTGDVTGSGTGSFAATIANNSVSLAKMADIATDRLIGRDTAATGDPEAITVGGGIEFTGTGGIQTSAFTGDVTKSTGGTALTIANDAVTFAKMQNVSTDIFLGRDTAGTGDVEELSVATAKTLLGLTGTNSGDQNLFSTIAVSGQSDVVADSATDTLTLVAGSNITITTNAGTDTITIAASGGGGSGTSFTSAVSQTTHGFAVGDLLYLSGTTYVKAIATSAAAAEVVGIVSAVAGANDFTIQYGGKVTGLSSLTAGEVYFLSPSSAGLATTTEPTTSGQISKPVYVADSTTTAYLTLESRGIQISTPSSGAWVYISSQTASSSATIDFTGLSSTYLAYAIVLNKVLPATDNVSFWCRTSTNNGSSYDAGASDYSWGISGQEGAAFIAASDQADNQIKLVGISQLASNVAGEGITGTVNITGHSDAAYCNVHSDLTFMGASTNYAIPTITCGRRVAAADVDAIRFLFSSGNIASGTFTLYGLTA